MPLTHGGGQREGAEVRLKRTFQSTRKSENRYNFASYGGIGIPTRPPCIDSREAKKSSKPKTFKNQSILTQTADRRAFGPAFTYVGFDGVGGVVADLEILDHSLPERGHSGFLREVPQPARPRVPARKAYGLTRGCLGVEVYVKRQQEDSVTMSAATAKRIRSWWGNARDAREAQ